MIKAIIFDFAGVIGTDGYWNWVQSIAIKRKNVIHKMADLANRVDNGSMTIEEFDHAVGKTLEVPAERVKQHIFDRIQMNHDLLKFIEKLHKKYKIAILSNFNQTRLDELFTRFNLSTFFDVVVCSSSYGFIKPEPKAYTTVLALLRVKPDEAIFVDDREGHVKGAERVGITGVIFTSNEQLHNDFQALGITV